MQTFLPIPSYSGSAACLDNKRLGKQRVECKQILLALGIDVGPHLASATRSGWRHHPAVVMWRDSELYLVDYAIQVCSEWIARGFNDSLLPQFEGSRLAILKIRVRHDRPLWAGDPAFHASHRSNLLRKYPSYYSQFGWSEPDDLPYVWPDCLATQATGY